MRRIAMTMLVLSVLPACGPDRRGRGDDDAAQPDDTGDGGVGTRCGRMCAHLYRDCGLGLRDAQGNAIEEAGCVQVCDDGGLEPAQVDCFMSTACDGEAAGRCLEGACEPQTCGSRCGDVPDGCGGTLHCRACGPTCEHACETGEKICNGAAVLVCGDYDGNGCREWNPQQECAGGSVCRAGRCSHPPVARLDCPTSASTGAPVRFDASRSSDPDGDALEYAFAADSAGSPHVSSLPTREHVYSSPGTYRPSVTVKDDSGLSATAGCTVSVFAALAAPAGFSATPGDARVDLTWGAVAGATSYRVYWATRAGARSAGNPPLEVTAPPWAHTGRTNGVAYFYVVTAAGPGGEGAASQEVSATPSAPAADLAVSIDSAGWRTWTDSSHQTWYSREVVWRFRNAGTAPIPAGSGDSCLKAVVAWDSATRPAAGSPGSHLVSHCGGLAPGATASGTAPFGAASYRTQPSGTAWVVSEHADGSPANNVASKVWP